MAKMNAGNWGALLQGGVQGAETEQKMTEQDLRNRYMKDAMVDPAARENQFGTENYNAATKSDNSKYGTNYQPFQPQGMLFDPVRHKLADVYQSAKAKLSSFLPGQGQHAAGPPAQATVPAPGNAPMSAPQPTSSGPSSGGVPGATGPMPTPQQDPTQQLANGGIPGRTGALRMRKAKPGNIAKPSKAAAAATPQPPVAPSQNTEAGPSDQDPQLANGGFLPSRMNPKPVAGPKPQPNAEEKDVKNFGQQSRFARTAKRFDDGGSTTPPTADEEAVSRGAANRAAKPGSVASSTTSAVNDTTQPAAGLEPAEPLAPKGIPGRALAGARKAVNGKLGGLYVAGATAAGANDSLHSSLQEYEDRFGFGHADEDPATLGGKARNLGVKTLGALTDVSNRIIPGAARAAIEANGNPWDSRQTPTAPHPAPQPSPDIDPAVATPNAQHMTPPAPAAGVPPRGAAPQQGPPKPDAPMDFSQVQIDHQDIPNTTAHEWDQMKASIIQGAAAKGVPLGQAQVMADDQISTYQHQNFVQYMQQGIALDRAGNKRGAMAALKTAYQYMPTGHDMGFGLDPKGNIVGYGVDEDSKKPVGQPVLLDQANLNHLLATFSDPKNFQAENLAMQEQRRKNVETTQGQVPYMRAHAGLAGAQQNYYNGLDAERRDVASIRANATIQSHAGHLPPDVSLKVNAALRNSGIMDPRDQFAATGVAAHLMDRGHSQADATAVAGMMYAPNVDPQQRAAYAAKYGIPLNEIEQQNPLGGIPPR